METAMKKTKKLIKRALKQPELYSPAELQYMEMIQKARKLAKKAAKAESSTD